MNPNSPVSSCNPSLLERFLSGDLHGSLEREFLIHLDTCDECRRALEQQAAEPESWGEAQQLLKPIQFDGQSSDVAAGLDHVESPSEQPLTIQNVLDALGPTDDPAMLGRLGGYEVSAVVGAGGMGVVLKACDRSLDRIVAIKVLAPHLASSGAARKRFAREAKAAAAVLHPNVIAIHSVSNDESLPYLVMPYVRGISLQKRLDREGPLSLHEILRIGSQIAAGLAAAHAQGLVHRDIKPANILLEDGVERLTITDFGLARAVDDATITHSGVIAGTPQFMSPEQARGEVIDQRSDLFSLGSVLYATCTGRPPFRAETTYGVMRRITDDQPTPIRDINADIPDWLCGVVERLMSKRAADRFESAQQVTGLLEQCLAHVQQPASAPLPVGLVRTIRRSSGWFNRRTGVIAMIAALLLAMFGFFALSVEAPDISGNWSDNEWGDVVLKKSDDGSYIGTYTETFGDEPGEIRLSWSSLEHRFNGTWREGKDRFGKISVRMVDDQIHGANTTSSKSKINPGVPRLAEFAWLRATEKVTAAAAKDDAPVAVTSMPAFGPIRDGLLPYGAPCYQQYFQFHSGKLMVVGRGPGTSPEEFKEDWKKVDSEGGADISLGRSGGIQLVGEGCIFTQDVENLKFDTLTANQAVSEMQRVNFSFGVMEPAQKSLPVTYLFKTARGVVGIMEILGIVDEVPESGPKVRGMKFRYKLVQQSAPAAGQRNPSSDSPADQSSKLPTDRPASETSSVTGSHRYQAGDRVKSIAVSKSTVFGTENNLLAIANGNVTFPLSPDWKRSVEILENRSFKHHDWIELTTKEEDEIIRSTEGLPHFEVGPLAYSPDTGSVLAVGTGLGQVKLFVASSGELIRVFDDEAGKLAEKQTPEKLKSLKRAMGGVAGLAFSPDGKWLVTCGSSFEDASESWGDTRGLGRRATGPGRLKIWEVSTGKLLHDLPGHSHVNSVAFNSKGTLLASAGSWDSGESHGTGVIVWNPQTGEKLTVIQVQANGGTHMVSFSPTKKLIAIGSLVFDKENNTRSATITVAYALSGLTEWQQTIPGWALPKAFTPDGKRLAVLSEGASIRMFDVETGSPKQEFKADDSKSGDRWNDFVISPDGKSLIIGGVDSDNKGIIEVRSLEAPAAAKP